MRPVAALAVALIALLSSSFISIADTGSADSAHENDEVPFYEGMEEHVLSSIDVITEVISKRSDNLPLPSGMVSMLEAVVEDDAEDSQAAQVAGHVRYAEDVEIEALRILGGAEVVVEDGVTVTVHRLSIESGGKAISFSTIGQGRIVIGSLAMEGLVMPLPKITVRADDASIESVYQRDGEERSFLLDVSYTHDLAVTIGDYTTVYSSEDQADIRMSISLDLTDFKGHVNAPGPQSTIDRLLRYIGSLDLIRLDLEIDVGGSYGVADYPTPFQVTDMGLAIDSHKDQDAPYYSVELSIGNVRIYPVDNSNMRIYMELPATKMKDGSRPTMDRSEEFRLTADSIKVDRVEPDEPLDVHVEDLDIEMASGSDSFVSLSMKKMAFKGIEYDEKGAFRVDTTVTDFKTRFDGTASEILDDMNGLMKKILSLDVVEGVVTLGKTEYCRYDADGNTFQKVTVNGLDMKVRFAIPQFRIHFHLDSYEYVDPGRDLSSGPIDFELWAGIDTGFDIWGIDSIKDLLRILSMRSVAEVSLEGDHGYSYVLGKGEAFLIALATEGLVLKCGDDTVSFDKASVMGLSLKDGIEIRYLRMTDGDAAHKIPSSLRGKLTDETIIELSNSLGLQKLSGNASISVNTDIDKREAGLYRIDVYRNNLELTQHTVGDGCIVFKTDSMGTYAVSGPLNEPEKTATAVALLALAVALGAATVLIGRRRFANRKG